ncbi:unnamed protein product [Thlaspi arvense]|uniref:Uncharacterized protein n=1 Tax=Thlaspi arvense TaxID=13288 RepID=A0AAU9SQ05_THLAR|nr:unnamed protein product [Thlaspi arvense]
MVGTISGEISTIEVSPAPSPIEHSSHSPSQSETEMSSTPSPSPSNSESRPPDDIYPPPSKSPEAGDLLNYTEVSGTEGEKSSGGGKKGRNRGWSNCSGEYGRRRWIRVEETAREPSSIAL